MSYKQRERDCREILHRCGKKIYRRVSRGIHIGTRNSTWLNNQNGYSKGPVHLAEYVRGSHKLFTTSLCGVPGRREWNPRKTTCDRCKRGGSWMQRLERTVRLQYEQGVL